VKSAAVRAAPRSGDPASPAAARGSSRRIGSQPATGLHGVPAPEPARRRPPRSNRSPQSPARPRGGRSQEDGHELDVRHDEMPAATAPRATPTDCLTHHRWDSANSHFVPGVPGPVLFLLGWLMVAALATLKRRGLPGITVAAGLPGQLAFQPTRLPPAGPAGRPEFPGNRPSPSRSVKRARGRGLFGFPPAPKPPKAVAPAWPRAMLPPSPTRPPKAVRMLPARAPGPALVPPPASRPQRVHRPSAARAPGREAKSVASARKGSRAVRPRGAPAPALPPKASRPMPPSATWTQLRARLMRVFFAPGPLHKARA